MKAIIIYILFFLISFLSLAFAEDAGNTSDVRYLLKTGKVAEATGLVQKEIAEHPENAGAHQALGRIYLLEGNEVKASGEFDKAASIDKDYSGKVIYEYYEAGLILLKDLKKSNIGLHYLNKYLLEKRDEDIEVASILYKEGFNMTGTNRFMAHVILGKAMELNPSYEKDEGFYFAYSVKSAHKSADVITGGGDFLTRFPGSRYVPEVLYLIGDAYFEMRKPQQAREYFKRVKERFPESEWAAKAAKRL